MTASDTILELHRSVGRIEGKIDAFIEQMKVHDERTTGLEVRTRGVENRQHWYSGFSAIAGAILGSIGARLFHG